MRTLTGGIVGAVLVGVVTAGCQARAIEEPRASYAPADARAQLVAASAPPAADAPASPLTVRCEPGQRAVIRQVPTGMGTQTEAGCVSDLPQAAAPLAAAPAGMYTPVAYQPQVQAVPAPYVVREAPVYARSSRATVRRTETQRTWKKRAVVIGGSAGAGAGIGALAGGKKGALIGAAIGGGAATLYEIAKK